ncbi:Fibronectin type III domain protein [Pseudomonas chlororaphis subsp. aurantiaca]|nr:Fibronectin type III domain protein [Pseudomonas chlororaphis subsp. aurantiaca]
MTMYSPPVAAGAACVRVRSARQTSQRVYPGRSWTQALRLLRNRSQPRGLGSGYTATANPVAAGAACDRARSARQTSLRADPGRSRTQALRLLRNRSQPRRLGSGYTATANPVAAAEGCDRLRSSRKACRCVYPGRSRTQALRLLRNRSQPRGLGSGYTATANPVAAGAACDRLRSSRKACQRVYPGRSWTQALRLLRNRSQPRRLGSGYTATANPVAAAEGCDRLRSSRKACQRVSPGRSWTQALRLLRNRSQPRGLGSGYTATANPVAAAEGCDRLRSSRKACRCVSPGRSRTQDLRLLRNRSQPRELGSGYTATANPVAAAEGCDRLRSSRKGDRCVSPGKSRAQVLRLLRNRSQPRRLGSGYTGHALRQRLPVRNKESRA